MYYLRFIVTGLGAGLCMLGAWPAQATPQYTVTVVGDATFHGASVNGAGQVAGYVTGSTNRAAVANGTSVTVIGPDGTTSSAASINDAGQIAGQISVDGASRGFRTNDGVMQALSTLGGNFGSSSAINAAGQTTGYSLNASGRFSAFVSNGTTLTELGSLGGFWAAGQDINKAGQVVGYTQGLAGQHAAYWDGPTARDLGTLGGTNSNALALNDAGQAVGWSETAAGATHATLWSDEGARDLGTLGGTSSWAADINGQGQIVGRSRFATGSTNTHAFMIDHGTMYDLNSLIVAYDPLYGLLTLNDSTSINDKGQILAFSNATGRTYLLTEVAEPASLLVLVIGLAGMAATRRLTIA